MTYPAVSTGTGFDSALGVLAVRNGKTYPQNS
jgi:hypothetical protein